MNKLKEYKDFAQDLIIEKKKSEGPVLDVDSDFKKIADKLTEKEFKRIVFNYWNYCMDNHNGENPEYAIDEFVELVYNKEKEEDEEDPQVKYGKSPSGGVHD